MWEVLDDAINLRDERDAPLTLQQWLGCERKKISSPLEQSSFELHYVHKEHQSRHHVHIQVLCCKNER